MTHVDAFKFDDDDGRFTLALWLDEEPEMDNRGRIILDIHSVAIELLDAAEKEIGPYRAEARAAYREFKTGVADDPSQQAVLDRIRGEGDWHSRKVPARCPACGGRGFQEDAESGARCTECDGTGTLSDDTHPYCPDEDGRCQYSRDEDCPRVDGPRFGESALDYYQRTGDDEPLRDMADHLRKAEREGA